MERRIQHLPDEDSHAGKRAHNKECADSYDGSDELVIFVAAFLALCGCLPPPFLVAPEANHQVECGYHHDEIAGRQGDCVHGEEVEIDLFRVQA